MSSPRLRLDHIGIAVENLEESRAKLEKLLGIPASPIETVSEEGVRVSFFDLGGARIELLEATTAESPIRKFLDKRRSGVHHLSLEIEGKEIAAHFEDLRSKGIQVLGEGPTQGSRGTRVFFVHPEASGGVLLEFSQFGERESGT